MGMAASQARLLTITARMHDVEYQAQSIQNAKIALSTQEDQVYKQFLDATNATTLVAKNSEGQMITATFNNLCGVGSNDLVIPNSRNGMYVIFNENHKMIVSDEIFNGYNQYKDEVQGDSPYEFAMYMLGIDECYGDADAIAQEKREYNPTLATYMDKMDEILEKYDINASFDDGENGYIDYSAFSGEWDLSDIEDDEDYDAFMEAYKAYEDIMYSNYFGDLQEYDSEDMDGISQSEFDYYARMYQQIEAAGGCVPISEYNGLNNIGNAANDSDFLKNMIGCGKFTVDIAEKDSKTGKIIFKATSVATDTGLEEVATTTIDKSAYAKAEHEYDNAMKKLDQKDKRFDMDLSKLETERSALKTEYDSVKKVVSDNIERTFGIFS